MAIPTLRTEIKRFLIISLWVVFSVGYFERFPLPGFLSKVYLITLAGLVSASAWGFGSLALKRRLFSVLNVEESVVFTTMAGFGILSLLMFLAGVFGFWTRSGAVLLIGIGLVLVWRHSAIFPLPSRERMKVRDGVSLAVHSGHPSSQPSPLKGERVIPFFLIAIGAILSFLLAFSPITYYDSLVYHLALPQAYIQAGRWVGQRELIYSSFPQVIEMIWTLGMLLANDVLANLLGWVISVLGILAVYAFGKRFFGSKTASWSAAFLSVMPAYLLLSSGGYVDIGLTVFSFLSFYVLCLWNETTPSQDGTPDAGRFLALAGFFSGCALGTKFTGAIPLGIGMLIILRKTSALAPITRIKYPAIYAGAALLVVSPWLGKNLYYVGNPVFPFFYPWSFKHLTPWMGGAAAGYFRGLTEYAPRSGWHLLKLFWDIGVNGLNFGGGMDVLGDLGWAPLFAFLPAVWLVRKKSPMVLLLLFYGICFFIPWGMSRPVLRFLMPVAPFLALVSAYGVDQGLGSQTRGVRLIGHMFLGVLLVSGFHNFFDFADALSVFKVPLGFESKAHYLTHVLKNNYYPAAAFLNNSLSNDTLTYVVGDQRGYYYNRPVLVTPVFNTNPLTLWANDASSAEDLVSRLKARGVTHLLINHTELQRLDSVYHLFPFTPQGQANWDALRSRFAKPLYHDADCDVLALL